MDYCNSMISNMVYVVKRSCSHTDPGTDTR